MKADQFVISVSGPAGPAGESFALGQFGYHLREHLELDTSIDDSVACTVTAIAGSPLERSFLVAFDRPVEGARVAEALAAAIESGNVHALSRYITALPSHEQHWIPEKPPARRRRGAFS